jgi:hypothetical protein
MSDNYHNQLASRVSSKLESGWDQRENIIKHIIDRGGPEYSNRHDKVLAIWKDFYVTKKFKNMWRAVNEHLPRL